MARLARLAGLARIARAPADWTSDARYPAPAHGRLQHRIAPQRFRAVAILVARRNLKIRFDAINEIELFQMTGGGLEYGRIPAGLTPWMETS